MNEGIVDLSSHTETFMLKIKGIEVQSDTLLKKAPKIFEVRRFKRGVVDARVSREGIEATAQVIVDFRALFVRVTSKHSQVTGEILLTALLNDYNSFTDTKRRYEPREDVGASVSTRPMKSPGRFLAYLHDLKDRGEVELSADSWFDLF